MESLRRPTGAIDPLLAWWYGPGSMADLKRIIYASDFSTASLAAFPHAVRLARLSGAG